MLENTNKLVLPQTSASFLVSVTSVKTDFPLDVSKTNLVQIEDEGKRFRRRFSKYLIFFNVNII